MPKNDKPTFEVVGTVVRKYQPENGTTRGRKWVRNKFLLKTVEGQDVYITAFGQLDVAIGADVKFEATRYNDTNYNLVGEIHPVAALSGQAPIPESPVQEKVSRRRGRPARNQEPEVAATSGQREQDSTAPVESSDEAIALVAANLNDARNLLAQLGYTSTLETVVTVGDMLGRTRVALRIERNKDRRTQEINSR